MSLGWIITLSILCGLFVIDLVIRMIEKHTILFYKFFDNNVVQFILYFLSIVIHYSFIIVLILAHSDIVLGIYITGALCMVWLVGSILDTLLYDISEYREKNRFGKLTILYKLGCVLDFLLFIFISIFTLNHIQDANLRSLILTIYSAIVGGGLTVVGVVITILHQDKERKKQDILMFKPYFNLITDIGMMPNFADGYYLATAINSLDRKDLNKVELGSNETIFYLHPIKFINSDHSNFIIEKVTINGNDVRPFDKLIQKNASFDIIGFEYLIDKREHLPEIFIHIKDVLENKYIAKINLEIKEEDVRIPAYIAGEKEDCKKKISFLYCEGFTINKK